MERSWENFLEVILLTLGGDYISIGTDKNSMGYLLKICLFYNILCRYKLKRHAYIEDISIEECSK